MEEHKASDTAALTAMLRAMHQRVDAEPRIVDDPIAARLVDDATRDRIATGLAALPARALMIPRAAVLLRSRYAEDLLARPPRAA
jgi:O-methyltransferase involved in polyketide biosynthesis